jgi:formylglycine-generating enzyme required for sulfatase activity
MTNLEKWSLKMHVYSWLLRCFSLVLSCAVLDAAAANAAMTASRAAWQDLGHGVLLQTRTGLRWTKKDNGQDIDWADAKSYCAKLGDRWRLPTIDELSNVYAAAEQAGESAACGNTVCKSPSQLQLSSAWHWSGSAVTKEQARDYDELAWGVTMVNGRRTMGIQFASYGARAWCVHGR